MRYLYNRILFLLLTGLFHSCANQLPPSGGEPDKLPPKILSVYPRPNTVNFSGNSIKIKFDEYVDKRSFQESFFIYPSPKGTPDFSWSGKEVEVTFPKRLLKNLTYLVVIGKDLKDLREGNLFADSYRFAFSTGNKIDRGIIEGKIISDNYDRVKVFAYRVSGKEINPEKDIPDYMIQSSDSGYYAITNLAEGKYRLFAVFDDDRNNLFGKDFEKISVPHDDVEITVQNQKAGQTDFVLMNTEIKKNDPEFLKSLLPDSSGTVFTNIPDAGEYILPGMKFYFYFKNIKPDKQEIVNNLIITDTSGSRKYNPVFNWITDSLLEVFSTEKFRYSDNLLLRLNHSKDNIHSLDAKLNVIDQNKTGSIEGKINGNEEINFPVLLRLINKENKSIIFHTKADDSGIFRFEDIPEGNYVLFAIADTDSDGQYSAGKHYPFKGSERILIYGSDLNIKGGWKTDNVFVTF